jgi:dolichol-phosphate mannosyltransferase
MTVLASPTLSVVLPCFNERESLEPLRQRLAHVLEKITCGSFEVIFVDDASTDGCSELLDALNLQDVRFKVIHFSRNFGHQAALSAGLDACAGAAVVLMDCDLQDPPEVIEKFFERWRDGNEVVYGVRRKRKEGILKRAGYAAFYRSMRMVAQIDVPLEAGDFCLMDRMVVTELKRLPESHRFLRGLRAWVGFRQVGVEYEREGRYAGEPKYTLGKLVRLAVSGYVGFSTVPLRIASWLGLLVAAIGFGIAVWAVGTKILGIASPRGWASTIAIMLFLGGIQLLVLGVMGEYLGRVYDEVRARPSYVVRGTVGFGEENPRPGRSDEARGRLRSSGSRPPEHSPAGVGTCQFARYRTSNAP